jgi:hypothetical protein
MPPRFSFNINLTSSVNGPLEGVETVGNIIIIIIIIIISWSHESKLVLSQWYIGPYLKQEQNVHVKANKKHRNVTNG